MFFWPRFPTHMTLPRTRPTSRRDLRTRRDCCAICGCSPAGYLLHYPRNDWRRGVRPTLPVCSGCLLLGTDPTRQVVLRYDWATHPESGQVLDIVPSPKRLCGYELKPLDYPEG